MALVQNSSTAAECLAILALSPQSWQSWLEICLSQVWTALKKVHLRYVIVVLGALDIGRAAVGGEWWKFGFTYDVTFEEE